MDASTPIGIVIGIIILLVIIALVRFYLDDRVVVRAKVLVGVGFAILIALAAAVSYGTAPVPGPDAANAAAIIGLITATAIGIERLIETFWTLVGLTKASAFWPLTDLSKTLEAEVNQLSADLTPFMKDAEADIKNLKDQGGEAAQKAAEAEKALSELRTYAAQLQLVASSNSVAVVRKVVDDFASGIKSLQSTLKEVNVVVTSAKGAITSLADLTAKIAANPGRVLTSLFIGILLGLLIAWGLRLDMFTAILGDLYDLGAWDHLTVAFTGIIMGLGSSPTHEAIRALQEYKESKK